MLPLPLLPVCVQLIFFFRPFRNRPLRSLISEKVARRQVGKQPFFWRRSGPEVLHLDLREKADPEVGGKAEIGLRRWGSRPAGPATQQTVKSGPLVLFSPVSQKKKKRGEDRAFLSLYRRFNVEQRVRPGWFICGHFCQHKRPRCFLASPRGTLHEMAMTHGAA